MNTKLPGITIWKSRKSITIRLRRAPKFDRSFTMKGLVWANPEDHKKVQEILNNAIDETKWVPYSDVAMKNLYHHLYAHFGKHNHLQKYKHIKEINAHTCFDRLLETKTEISKDDAVLTELRLIRNYLEKLTLLQEASNG